jgi:hypothetical protein
MEINGKRVVDATKPIKITITPKDISKGDNKNPSGCAAAQAAMHSVPDCISARVHIGRVYIEQEKRWVRYNTSDALRTEIVAFDRGGQFEPGEYTLRPISANETQEGRARKRGEKNRNQLDRGTRAKKRNRVLIAKVKRHEVTGIRPKGANR